IGLVLALADFFDLTPELEKKLDALTTKYQRLLTVFKGVVIRSDEEIDRMTKAQERFMFVMFGAFCGLPAATISALFAYRVMAAYFSGEPLDLVTPGRKAFGFIPAGGIGELILSLLLTPFVFVTIAFMILLLLALSMSTVYYCVLAPLGILFGLMD